MYNIKIFKEYVKYTQIMCHFEDGLGGGGELGHNGAKKCQ